MGNKREITITLFSFVVFLLILSLVGAQWTETIITERGTLTTNVNCFGITSTEKWNVQTISKIVIYTNDIPGNGNQVLTSERDLILLSIIVSLIMLISVILNKKMISSLKFIGGLVLLAILNFTTIFQFTSSWPPTDSYYLVHSGAYTSFWGSFSPVDHYGPGPGWYALVAAFPLIMLILSMEIFSYGHASGKVGQGLENDGPPRSNVVLPDAQYQANLSFRPVRSKTRITFLWWIKGIMLFGTLFIGLLLFGVAIQTIVGNGSPITILNFLSIVFMAIFMIFVYLYGFRNWYDVDDTGITRHAPWSKEFKLLWSDIDQIRIGITPDHSQELYFILVGKGKKVRLGSQSLIGISAFAYYVTEHVPRERWLQAERLIQSCYFVKDQNGLSLTSGTDVIHESPSDVRRAYLKEPRPRKYLIVLGKKVSDKTAYLLVTGSFLLPFCGLLLSLQPLWALILFSWIIIGFFINWAIFLKVELR